MHSNFPNSKEKKKKEGRQREARMEESKKGGKEEKKGRGEKTEVQKDRRTAYFYHCSRLQGKKKNIRKEKGREKRKD